MFKVLFLFILLLSFPLNGFSDPIRPQDPNLPGISKTDKEVTKYLKEVTGRMDYWTYWLERLSPKYVWGGVGITKGGDCSGQVYWVCHMSGLPYLRTTALQMWNGAWPGEVIKSWKTSAFPNLIYFTFSEKRPAGHVGIIRKNYHPDYLIFAEASSSAKMFKRTIIESNTKHEKAIIGIQKLDLTVGFKTEKSKK